MSLTSLVAPSGYRESWWDQMLKQLLLLLMLLCSRGVGGLGGAGRTLTPGGRPSAEAPPVLPGAPEAGQPGRSHPIRTRR